MQNTANYKFKKPENTDLYNVQDFSDNMDAIDTALKGIEDGTTTVGNALQLGGKGASEYITKDGGTVKTLVVANAGNANVNVRNTSGMDAFVEFIGHNGSSAQRIGLLGMNGNNVPTFKNTAGTTYPLLHSGNVGDYALTARGMTPATSLDTVKENGTYYVHPSSTNRPNDGSYGEMLVMSNVDTTGQLYISHVNDIVGLMFRGATTAGGFYPWKVVLDNTNVGEYALPKSGGTVTSPYGTVMTLRSTAGNEVVMQYRNSADDNEGSLGFNGIDNPIFKKTDGTNLQLLHTGNSAKVAIQSTAPTDTSALWVW